MSPELQRDPLRTQLKNLLIERILTREFSPGQPLKLNRLAEEWDVSATPLREALLTLEHEGLVGYKRGKGFYVWPLSAEESVNLYQIAGALERLALRKTEEFPPPAIERLKQTNDNLRRAQGNPEEMIKWDGHFHHALVQDTSNEDLLEMIDQVRNRLYRYRFYGYEYVVTQGTDEKRVSVDEHADIIRAVETDELDAAADLLEQHWERGTELMQRWLSDPDEGPEYERSV